MPGIASGLSPPAAADGGTNPTEELVSAVASDWGSPAPEVQPAENARTQPVAIDNEKAIFAENAATAYSYVLGVLAGSSETGQNAVATVIRVAKRFDLMSHRGRDRHQEAVVIGFAQADGLAHLEAQATTNEYERDVVASVRIPLTQFVRPYNRGVVQERAFTARFGRLR